MSALDLLGLNRIFKGDTYIKPTRKILRFLGEGWTIVDNPATKTTDISFAGGGEGTITGPGTVTPGHVTVWGADETEVADGGVALADIATTDYVDDAIAAIPPPTGTGDTFSGGVNADNEIARYNAANSKTIQRSTPKIEDDGRITTVTDPSGAQDADTKAARDAAITAAGAAWSTAIFRGYAGHTISNLGIPPTTWTDLISGLALTWVDDVTGCGVTRSGSSFTFTAPGYYRLTSFVNMGGINCFLALRWRRGSTTVASRTVYNSADPSYYQQSPTVFENVVYVAAGDTLTIQVARSGGGAGAGWAGSAVDGETGWSGTIQIARVGPGVGDPGVGLTPASNWRTYCDFNFTQLPNQTIVQGVNTIAGIPMRADYVANATTFAIVNGTGLYVKNNTVNSNFYYSNRNAPMLFVDLPVDVPGWVLDVSEVRVSCEWLTTVATANYTASGFGVAKQPWVVNADLSVHFWHQYSAGMRRAIARLYTATEVSPAITSTHNTGMIHFRTQYNHSFFSKQNVAADSTPNATVLDPATMTKVGHVAESSTTGGINPVTQYITNLDHFIAFWTGHSDNTLGNAEHVCKRLRIEYKL